MDPADLPPASRPCMACGQPSGKRRPVKMPMCSKEAGKTHMLCDLCSGPFRNVCPSRAQGLCFCTGRTEPYVLCSTGGGHFWKAGRDNAAFHTCPGHRASDRVRKRRPPPKAESGALQALLTLCGTDEVEIKSSKKARRADTASDDSPDEIPVKLEKEREPRNGDSSSTQAKQHPYKAIKKEPSTSDTPVLPSMRTLMSAFLGGSPSTSSAKDVPFGAPNSPISLRSSNHDLVANTARSDAGFDHRSGLNGMNGDGLALAGLAAAGMGGMGGGSLGRLGESGLGLGGTTGLDRMVTGRDVLGSGMGSSFGSMGLGSLSSSLTSGNFDLGNHDAHAMQSSTPKLPSVRSLLDAEFSHRGPQSLSSSNGAGLHLDMTGMPCSMLNMPHVMPNHLSSAQPYGNSLAGLPNGLSHGLSHGLSGMSHGVSHHGMAGGLTSIAGIGAHVPQMSHNSFW